MWILLEGRAAAIDASEVVREVVIEVAPAVEEAAGRSFDHLPTVVVSSQVEEVAVLRRELAIDLDADALRPVGAWYRPDNDEIVVFWDAVDPAMQLDPSGDFARRTLRCFLAHELTHALQRQQGLPATTDRAALALREGHAQAVALQVCRDDPAAVQYLVAGLRQQPPSPALRDALLGYVWAPRYVARLGQQVRPDAIWTELRDPPPIERIWLGGAPDEGDGLVAAPWPSRSDARAVCRVIGEDDADWRELYGTSAGIPPIVPDDVADLGSVRGGTTFRCGEVAVIVRDMTARPAPDETVRGSLRFTSRRYVRGRWIEVSGPPGDPALVRRIERALDQVPELPADLRWTDPSLQVGPEAATARFHTELEQLRTDGRRAIQAAVGGGLRSERPVAVREHLTVVHQPLLTRRLVDPVGFSTGAEVVVPWRPLRDLLLVDPSGRTAREWVRCAGSAGLAEQALADLGASHGNLAEILLWKGVAAEVAERGCAETAARAWLRKGWWDPDDCLAGDCWIRIPDDPPPPPAPDPPSWDDPWLAFGVALRAAERGHAEGRSPLDLAQRHPTLDQLWDQGRPEKRRPVPSPGPTGRIEACRALETTTAEQEGWLAGPWGVRAAFSTGRTALRFAESTSQAVQWICGRHEIVVLSGSGLERASDEYVDDRDRRWRVVRLRTRTPDTIGYVASGPRSEFVSSDDHRLVVVRSDGPPPSRKQLTALLLAIR